MDLMNWLFMRTPEAKSSATMTHPEARPAAPVGFAAPKEHHRFGSAEFILPPTEYRFIAIDVETANDWNGSICQIGLAMVGPQNEISTYSTLIDPECDFAPTNVRLHGIDSHAVRGMPTFFEAIQVVAQILTRQPVIQHSQFDRGAVAAACEALGISPPGVQWMDSVLIARRAWPELAGTGGGHNLANLKRVLGLEFRHHDAGEDARAAAQVVLLAERATGLSFADLAKGQSPPAKTYPKRATRTGAAGKPLSGAIVVFTGQLDISRDEAADLAAEHGMTVKASVTMQTNFVVVGEQDLSVLVGHTKSSKHRKAEELAASGHPIRIIGEAEFLQMCRAGRLG